MVYEVCNFEDFETLTEVRKYFMFQIKITNYLRTHKVQYTRISPSKSFDFIIQITYRSNYLIN